MTVQLPTPGGDVDTWGDDLNAFLSIGLNPDGTVKATAVIPPITKDGAQGRRDRLDPLVRRARQARRVQPVPRVLLR